MKRLFIILVAGMLFAFISCERASDVSMPETPETPETPEETGDTIPTIEEQSPIKGVWKYNTNGLRITLDYGDDDVKLTYYLDFYNATAIYDGTYMIEDSVITHHFTSLTTKNSSKIGYYSPENMPKEATLEDDNTIIYINYSFKRE